MTSAHGFDDSADTCMATTRSSHRACSWSAPLPLRLLLARFFGPALARLLGPALPSRSLCLVSSHHRRRRNVPACLHANRINSPCSPLGAIELFQLWRICVLHSSSLDGAAQVAQDEHRKAKRSGAHANALGPVGGVSIRVKDVRTVAKAERLHDAKVSERATTATLRCARAGVGDSTRAA